MFFARHGHISFSVKNKDAFDAIKHPYLVWPASVIKYWSTKFVPILFTCHDSNHVIPPPCFVILDQSIRPCRASVPPHSFGWGPPPPVHKTMVCLTQGHNLSVRHHSTPSFISLPLILQSFSAILVVLCLQPSHRQLALPLISPLYFCSRQSFHQSINPYIHFISIITQGLTTHVIFLFLCPCLSITISLYLSIHTFL